MGIWCDLNHDGFMELFVGDSQNGSPVATNSLYRNNGNDNGWLKVKLIGTTSNRDAIGAKVRMLAAGHGQLWQRRDITGGDGYNGSQLYAQIGLGRGTGDPTPAPGRSSNASGSTTR